MKSKPHVAAFMAFGGFGGAEHIFLAYLAALRARGWPIGVIVGGTLSDEDRTKFALWGPGLDLVTVPWRRRTDYAFPVILPSLDRTKVRGLREALRKLAPDLVLINQPGPDDAQGAIRAASRLRPETKVVCFVHLAAAKLLKMRLKRTKILWARHLFGSVDKIVTVSRASGRSLVEDYGLPESKVVVAWNGTEDLASGDHATDALAVRREFGLTESEVVVFWAGRFTGEKGIDVLLDAMERMRLRLGNVRILLAGDGPLAEELSARGAALIQDRSVTFLGWRADVPRLLQASDIVVMPSRVESFPLLLLEACSAGKPTVASHVHGIPEIVADGETGILVPPDDPPALAEAIERLARDPELRRRMGQAGRKRYEELFTLEKATERFETALRNVLEGR